MVAFSCPAILRPADVKAADGWLEIWPSDAYADPPGPGVWRSFAETDPADLPHIEAIARQFGSVTTAGLIPWREPLEAWQRLIEDLRQLGQGWTAAGAIAAPPAVAQARLDARQIQHRVLAAHQASGGRFDIDLDGSWFLVCTELAQWWRLAAIGDLQRGTALRRCRHCHSWFSLAGLRADAGFCSPAHRSAFYQQRRPSAAFWADLV